MFPTPERKGLFIEGFPTLKWLKEMFAQDEPFDHILTRYFNPLFLLIILFSDFSSPFLNIFCIYTFLDFFTTFDIKFSNGGLLTLMVLLQIKSWREGSISGLTILINFFYVKSFGDPSLAQYLFRNGLCK